MKRIVKLMALSLSSLLLAACGNASQGGASTSATPSSASPESSEKTTSSEGGSETSSSQIGGVSSSEGESTPTSGTDIIKTYTITWKNYDGTVIEIDENVEEGTMPHFDGEEPTRQSDTEYEYTWSGWSPELTVVTSDCVYTATYTSEKILSPEERYATKPFLSADMKTIKYGLYPQKNVSNESIVAALNALVEPESNGWYLYKGTYYAKTTADPYGTTAEFEDGTEIVRDAVYWFECEPIVWNVLKSDEGKYLVVSSVLLDVREYYESREMRTLPDGTKIFPNDYEHSDLRAWLNGDFYNTAFALGNDYVQTTTLENSKTGEYYGWNDTIDQVFILSKEDYQNVDYGFEDTTSASESRYCIATDWARANGAFNNKESFGNRSSYWTRTPYGNSNIGDGGMVWCVQSTGSITYYEQSVNKIYYNKCCRVAIWVSVD